MAEIGCYASRRSYAEVHYDCQWTISYLGKWLKYGEFLSIYLFFVFLGFLCLMAFSGILLLTTGLNSLHVLITRRAKVEPVRIHLQLKDQWDLFLALLSMRRSLTMNCKVLLKAYYVQDCCYYYFLFFHQSFFFLSAIRFIVIFFFCPYIILS